jgi:hypothetical protein
VKREVDRQAPSTLKFEPPGLRGHSVTIGRGKRPLGQGRGFEPSYASSRKDSPWRAATAQGLPTQRRLHRKGGKKAVGSRDKPAVLPSTQGSWRSLTAASNDTWALPSDALACFGIATQ